MIAAQLTQFAQALGNATLWATVLSALFALAFLACLFGGVLFMMLDHRR